MKFVREVIKEGLKIPVAATKLSKMEASDKVDLFVSEDGMVLLKRKMTAMELIRASQYLHQIASELIVHLALACGSCEDCNDCCPCEDLEEERIALPDSLLVPRAESAVILLLL